MDTSSLIPPLVSVDWLRANATNAVLCDVRYYLDGRDGLAAHLAGHLPGAVFIDIYDVLASPAGPVIGSAAVRPRNAESNTTS